MGCYVHYPFGHMPCPACWDAVMGQCETVTLWQQATAQLPWNLW